MSRLLRHDRVIVWNTIRATFEAWHDRVVTVLVLGAAFAIVRVWFTDRPWTAAAWAALAAGSMIGVAAGRLVASRLAFHAFDGLLAADALQPRMRRRYAIAWHGVGLALLTVITLVARPSLLAVSVPAYLAGALVAALTGGLVMPRRIGGRARPGWTIRAWSHRPIAGLSSATVLLLALLPARTLGTNALAAVVGVGAVMFALMLTTVDDAVVRFMTIAGHGARRVVAHHAKGAVTLLATAAPACWAMLGPIAAAVVAATCTATLLLLTLRILAYRLYPRRLADLIVGMLAGLLMLVASSVPVALPLVALTVLWQLQRRGRAKTWLLA